MSRIVEAILGHRRCDCKCNRVQQPVIINNNIYVPQSQQPSSSSSGSAAVGVSALADVAGASIPLPPAVPVAITSNQNYLNLIQALSHQRL